MIQRRWVHIFLSFIFFVVILSGTSALGNDNLPVVKNIEFVNADLRDVFRSLAAAGKFTIIIEPRVHGNVTLTLRYGVTVRDAVSVIAKTYGYSCRWLTDSATALVGSTQFIRVNFDHKISKVYPLKYAQTKDIAESLEVVIPKTRIKADLQKNQIIVLANEIEINNITELIGKLDRQFQPIDFDVQMEEVPNSIWNKLGIANNYQPPHMGVYVLKEQQIKVIEEIVPSLITKSSFSGLDNHPLKIFLGDKIPLITTKKRKGDLNYQVEYIDAGNSISFNPQINSEHQLTLVMKALVSTVANKAQIGTKKWIPWVVNRDFQSTIRMEAGQTILLSGLLQRNEYQMMKSSPYHFPELDKLFASQKLSESVGANLPTEMIVLVTPRITDKNSSQPNGVETLSSSPTAPNSNSPESAGNVISQSGDQAQTAPNNSLSPSADGKLPIDEDKPEVKISLEPSKENSSQVVLKPDVVIVQNNGKTNLQFTEIRYRIKKGDTLTSIVKKFATNPGLVKAKNNLNETGTIQEDLVLIIPVPNDRIYVLKPKETLWRISKRYGTTLEVLKDLNGISDETKVNAGQLIVLPRANFQIVNPQF